MPNLKICLSEGGIGWIPYFLERSEQLLEKHRYWTARGQNVEGHALVDSELDLMNLDVRQLFKDHIYGCFIDDVHGLHSLDEIGEDNVLIETDYPHSDSTWPDSIEIANKQMAHLSKETQYKILRGNAERLFRFEPANL